MIILSIETSADDTGVSIIEAIGDFPTARYTVLGNALRSQIEHHQSYGGIFPNIAKREHAAVILPLLAEVVRESKLELLEHPGLFPEQKEHVYELLYREHGLADNLIHYFEQHGIPNIDLISVTAGPGLEPALWVGVNFAKALSQLWNVPVVPVNHMEGHVLASVFDGRQLAPLQFPALALLISGGHTELILMNDWQTYERVGQTRDDAVGEAFDKVARVLGLPYPGGPEIEKLSSLATKASLPQYAKLPRPMLTSGDLDFSFSGLKTAVRYAVQDTQLSETETQAIARDFSEAVRDVLLAKTVAAVEQFGIQSVVVGGGVSASSYLRNAFLTHFNTYHPDVTVYFPERGMSTDNSVMIALAGHARANGALEPTLAESMIKADGNRSITEESSPSKIS